MLLRCCVNLLDFYSRLGVAGEIVFSREFYFVEPGGRDQRPAPQLAVVPGPPFSEPLREAGDRARIDGHPPGTLHAPDLERITMLQWLQEKRQPARAIQRFWRQVLVSAVNEELDRMAAIHALQVFELGFLSNPEFYQMGVPSVPLARLYAAEAWRKLGKVEILPRTPAQRVIVENGEVRGLATAGGELHADFYISAVPFDRVGALAPELIHGSAGGSADGNPGLDLTAFEHSPITGIHLWFDRPITALPHATLLDRTIQWMFNKSQGRYIELVVSASRSLVETKREDVIALALRELAEFFPAVRQARLEKSHVVKEIRATFSAKPGLEAHRPPSRTSLRNLFLAGDWTKSGLARHHGRRGGERVSGRGGSGRRRRRSAAFLGAIIEAMRKLFVAMLLYLTALSLAAADTTRIHIHVVNDLGKPVGNAEVIVKFIQGRNLVRIKKKESWELRTTQEGTVSLPSIPQGKVLIQINAKNYQTFGQTYDLLEDEKTVEIQLLPPQPQYSSDPAPAKK